MQNIVLRMQWHNTIEGGIWHVQLFIDPKIEHSTNMKKHNSCKNSQRIKEYQDKSIKEMGQLQKYINRPIAACRVTDVS